MRSMLIKMLISMLLLSDSSSARLLISWFELVHPIHGSADRIFRWVDEQSLMEKHDSYSMFIVTTSVSIDCVILMGHDKRS